MWSPKCCPAGCLPHEPSVLGHIVLVSRGGCTFQDKVNRIQDRPNRSIEGIRRLVMRTWVALERSSTTRIFGMHLIEVVRSLKPLKRLGT